MDVNVRFAVTKVDFHCVLDSDNLLEALRTYALDPMGGGEDLSDYAKENLVVSLQQRPTCHAFLLKEVGSQQVAGFSICFEGFSTFACAPLLNIHDFAILPSFRGRGLGSILLEGIEESCKSFGCCKITLEVLEGNEVARKLYKKQGYVPYELDPAMGKALFLQKKLI